MERVQQGVFLLQHGRRRLGNILRVLELLAKELRWLRIKGRLLSVTMRGQQVPMRRGRACKYPALLNSKKLCSLSGLLWAESTGHQALVSCVAK
jgi:hypothetical protein